jgi:hypothetical protein
VGAASASALLTACIVFCARYASACPLRACCSVLCSARLPWRCVPCTRPTRSCVASVMTCCPRACGPVHSIAADVRHLLSALRRFRGLRRPEEGRAHSPAEGDDWGGVEEYAHHPTAPPTVDHLRVLASGQAALESMENWMSRQFLLRPGAPPALLLSSALGSGGGVGGVAVGGGSSDGVSVPDADAGAVDGGGALHGLDSAGALSSSSGSHRGTNGFAADLADGDASVGPGAVGPGGEGHTAGGDGDGGGAEVGDEAAAHSAEPATSSGPEGDVDAEEGGDGGP